MATSWTQADITALETAIKSGVLSVQFGDRSVQYHSVAEMLKLLDTMKAAVEASSGTTTTRTTYAVFKKG
jgi:hypothetical protein